MKKIKFFLSKYKKSQKTWIIDKKKKTSGTKYDRNEPLLQ
jgi:hypothetical protein